MNAALFQFHRAGPARFHKAPAAVDAAGLCLSPREPCAGRGRQQMGPRVSLLRSRLGQPPLRRLDAAPLAVLRYFDAALRWRYVLSPSIADCCVRLIRGRARIC
jgi:hypothetical protein